MQRTEPEFERSATEPDGQRMDPSEFRTGTTGLLLHPSLTALAQTLQNVIAVILASSSSLRRRS